MLGGRALVGLVLLVAAGCGGARRAGGDASTPHVDAGPRDSGASLDAGSNIDAATQPDAGPPVDAGTDADVQADARPPDAGPSECRFVPSTSTDDALVSYSFSRESFASYGCAPVDPTYWLAGDGPSVTITFAAPQDRPTIRVWGMNTDDTAAISVDGAAYYLDASSASYAPKVVCGLSPGPDGVAFVDGLLAGANSAGDGNYSYQDVTLETTNVTSIVIRSRSGAGWGFAGVCPGSASGPG